jgi:hypothetical protein
MSLKWLADVIGFVRMVANVIWQVLHGHNPFKQ